MPMKWPETAMMALSSHASTQVRSVMIHLPAKPSKAPSGQREKLAKETLSPDQRSSLKAQSICPSGLHHQSLATAMA